MMKFAATLALVAVSQAQPISDESAEFLYKKFLVQHEKGYGAEEHSARFETFKSNLNAVQEHNAAADEGKFSFRLGMNQFGDWTNEEYRKSLSEARPGNGASSTFVAKGTATPDAIDWRTKGAVNPVKNQGSCGSCWAFSAVVGMEGAIFLSTGKLQSFSEQQQVDCVLNGVDDCNHGGFMNEAFEDVMARGGVELEADYPYKGSSGNKCAFDASKIAGKLTGYKNVTSGDEGALKEAAALQPISVAIDASSFFFQLYHSGVYDDIFCKNGEENLDHGVAVVGYGTSGKDYWLVRNSWGASWGQSGYIWMVRNKKNACGIATSAQFPQA